MLAVLFKFSDLLFYPFLYLKRSAIKYKYAEIKLRERISIARILAIITGLALGAYLPFVHESVSLGLYNLVNYLSTITLTALNMTFTLALVSLVGAMMLGSLFGILAKSFTQFISYLLTGHTNPDDAQLSLKQLEATKTKMGYDTDKSNAFFDFLVEQKETHKLYEKHDDVKEIKRGLFSLRVANAPNVVENVIKKYKDPNLVEQQYKTQKKKTV